MSKPVSLFLTIILVPFTLGACAPGPLPSPAPAETTPTPVLLTPTGAPPAPTVAEAAETPPPVVETPPAPLRLSSSAFEHQGEIPAQHAVCPEEVNNSPPLNWSNVPLGAQSFALVCLDPVGTYGYEGVPESAVFTHWVVYNIPPSVTALPEAVPAVPALDDGILQGRNDYGKVGYGGPCPPSGDTHFYFFTLYALDVVLDLPADSGRDVLLQAMEGHILAQAELVGTYSWE